MPSPTYDSRATGPRYWVTTEIAGRAAGFRKPLDDPFIRHTVTIGWPRLLAGLLHGRLRVTVTVGAPSDLMDDVLDLDLNYNRGHAAAPSEQP